MKKLFSSRVLAIGLFVSLITVIGISSAFADTTPKGKPFIAINDQIIEVEGAISSIEDQIDILVGRVDTIEGKVAANEIAITGLLEQNETLSTLVDQNLNDITAIQTEIDTLKQADIDLRSLIESNSGDIVALGEEVAENDALITTLQSAILLIDENVIDIGTSLQEQIDHNLILIGVLQNQIDEININISFKQDLVNGICPETQAIGEINPDGSVVCHDPSTSDTLGVYRVWQTFTVPIYGYVSARLYCSGTDIPISVGYSYGHSALEVRRAYISGGGGKLNGYVTAENMDYYSPHNIMFVLNCASGAEITTDNP